MIRALTPVLLALCLCAHACADGLDAFVGQWSGAYVKDGSTLRVDVRIARGDDGALAWSERMPEWLLYGWFDPEPATLDDAGALTAPSLYGGATLVLDEQRAEMIGACTENGVTLHLKRVPPDPPETAPAEVEVSFGDDARLAGTLVLPRGEGPFACVVMVHPRGCYTRAMGLRRARFFARHGYAALAYDQRGAGDSEGSCAGRTIDELTRDLTSAVACARRHASIDPARVGVLGVSAGAWVCQGAAGVEQRAGRPLAFVATWVGPATSVAEQQRGSTLALGAELGLSDQDVALVLEHVDLQLGAPDADALARFTEIERAAREGGWLNSMFAPDDFPRDEEGFASLWLPRHRYDPAADLASLEDTRYFAVFGSDDPIVPLDDNRAALVGAMGEGCTIVVVPGMGHDLSRAGETRRVGDTDMYAFERPDPRPYERTLTFLREIGMTTR
ncbi:MAG: alpha/beta hydrolase [Planctomycetota bacterium]